MTDIQDLLQFLHDHHVMSLATHGKEGPHVAPVFYALRDYPLELFFFSDPKTRHMKEIQKDPRVSVGIYLETKKIGVIQGVQIWGRAESLRDSSEAEEIYFKVFPHARLYPLTHRRHRFCIIRVENARLIDNRFGIGKKKEWILKDGNISKII